MSRDFSSSGLEAAILDFEASGYIWQYCQQLRWTAGHRKCGSRIWNFVPISSMSRDLSTSSLVAAILDFGASGYIWQYCQQLHSTAGPRTCGCSLWNFVSIWCTRWDIAYTRMGQFDPYGRSRYSEIPAVLVLTSHWLNSWSSQTNKQFSST